MTIIELFPWLLAIASGILAVPILRSMGLASTWAVCSAIAIVVEVRLMFLVASRHILEVLGKRRMDRGRAAAIKRKYHSLDWAKQSRSGGVVFYGCMVCGNFLSANVRKPTHCACGNIKLCGATSMPEIRDQERVRVFSEG